MDTATYETAKATYHRLLAESADAILARDAIESCISPEWRAAHQRARDLCLQARAIRHDLAQDPTTRYGDWRTEADRMSMMLGAL